MMTKEMPNNYVLLIVVHLEQYFTYLSERSVSDEQDGQVWLGTWHIIYDYTENNIENQDYW